MNITITSLQNSLVKKIVSLRTRKGRNEYQQFIVEGQRMIAAFLEAGQKPVHFFITQKGYASDLALTHQHKNYSVEVSELVMQKMSAAATPSGLLAVFDIPEPLDVTAISGPESVGSASVGPAIVLLELADPGNMGTLIRTAIALDFSVVIIGGVDCWSPKVVQASAGALAFARIIKSDWISLVAQARSQNMILSALVVKDGITPEKADLSQGSLLVVGSEAHGISQQHLEDCQQKITLAMPGNTESLNAAIAGSIAMYVAYQKLNSI